ncbi:hypothetical protein TNCV_2587011 [Trichonephila clavipes]|nr:hypothetical protein TNCV_2587011 [Trichonephila clavipes]
MKKFDQTPYKLPPPTSIHVPAEKRILEEKSLPFSKKRSKVRITPVMRRVSRRCELPMAPVQIPQDPQPPVQIPQVPQPPVQIPDVLQPVQIPDVLEPVQIPDVLDQTCADSTCPTITCADSSASCPRATCTDSTCPRSTCADSSVTSTIVTCADSTCADSTCAYSRCSRTCADSSVTSPTPTYADYPRTYADSTCIRTCADSSVPSPTATYADSTCIRTCANSSIPSPTVTCANSSVTSPTVTCPDSTCADSPEPMQILPELNVLDPLESTDAFDQLMSFVFGPQELQLLHTVPSIFDGNLFSFLDEFERAPMDLTMPRLNTCVKKSIGVIQPMSVNSCL